jgi:transposase
MWTPDAQAEAEHDRDDLRYPSDLTNAEWQVLAPLFPAPATTGRHRAWPMLELINAMTSVFSLAARRTGVAALTPRFGPRR